MVGDYIVCTARCALGIAFPIVCRLCYVMAALTICVDRLVLGVGKVAINLIQGLRASELCHINEKVSFDDLLANYYGYTVLFV